MLFNKGQLHSFQSIIERKHYAHFTRLLKIALKDVLQQIKTRSVEKTMQTITNFKNFWFPFLIDI